MDVGGHDDSVGEIAREENVGGRDGVSLFVELDDGDIHIGCVWNGFGASRGDVAIFHGRSEIEDALKVGELDGLEQPLFEDCLRMRHDRGEED